MMLSLLQNVLNLCALASIALALGTAVWLGLAYIGGNASRHGHRPPRTGIEIFHGLPGSGKSYYACKMLLESIIQDRRPVYTNLPLRYRVLRLYLQIRLGSFKAANYIQPLTEVHITAFLHRWAALHEWRNNGGTVDSFLLKHGPHITTGPGANWLPYASMIVVDEAHHWFPQVKMNDQLVLTFATMHRHGWFNVVLMSQHPMQICLAWRRLCTRYIMAINRGAIPLLMGLRLPIDVLQYGEFPGVAAVNGEVQGMKPVNTWMTAPAFSSGLIFRLYNSHTHAGSPRQMSEQLEKTRDQVEGKDRPKPKANRWRTRKWRFLIVGGSVFALAACTIGAAAFNRDKTQKFSSLDDVPKHAKGPSAREEGALRLPPLTAVGPNMVVIEGAKINAGETYESATLLAADPRDAVTMWSLPPHAIAWAAGARPVFGSVQRTGKRMGFTPTTLDAVRAIANNPTSDPALRRWAVTAAPQSQGGTAPRVGTRERAGQGPTTNPGGAGAEGDAGK